MKNFTIFLTILVSIALVHASHNSNIQSKTNCLINGQTRIYEDKILQAIEDFRNKLKNEGLPEFGIPSLDPLDLDDKQINLNVPDLLDLNLNLTLRSEGLLGFEITNLKIALIGLKLDFTITFPQVSAGGNYGLLAHSSLVNDNFQVHGNGDIHAIAHNFTIIGRGNLGTILQDGKIRLQVKNAEVDTKLDKFDFKIEGLLGSDIVSEIASKGISTSMPKILEDLDGEINELLTILIEQLNEWLKDNDIIGGGTNMLQLYEQCF